MNNQSRGSEKIPDEVYFVWMIQLRNQGVGSEMLKKVNDIIERNPKYFEWEHKYNSIPKEVHEAFQRECYPNKFKTEWDSEGSCEGVYNKVIKNKPNYVGLDTMITKDRLMELWRKHEERENEKQKRDAEIRKIWHKHYGKYKLSFREF